MNEALQPCPFCGADRPRVFELVTSGPALNDWTVECSDCTGNIDRMDTRATAIEAWNARPTAQRRNTMMDYQIVTGYGTHALELKVNQWLDRGWMLVGGVAVEAPNGYTALYSQAMTSTKESREAALQSRHRPDAAAPGATSQAFFEAMLGGGADPGTT